jgi:Ribonucleotide reductase, all-alpha domain
MSTVVAAIANSAAADPVLRAALAVARLTGAEVVSIHVVETDARDARTAASFCRARRECTQRSLCRSAVRAWMFGVKIGSVTQDKTRDLGVGDELGLTIGACALLRERYLRRDERGRIVESTGKMMDRVARHVAGAEDEHRRGSSEHWSEEFARSLRSLEFLPTSPTLMNAGTGIGLLSACFVLPLEDSLESSFGTVCRDYANNTA